MPEFEKADLQGNSGGRMICTSSPASSSSPVPYHRTKESPPIDKSKGDTHEDTVYNGSSDDDLNLELEEEEQILSSSTKPSQTPPPAAVKTPVLSTTPSFVKVDAETMLAFYNRVFPFRLIFQWLNHSPSPSTDFSHREIAFSLQNGAYMRYNAYPNWETFKRDVLRLNPTRFEIGPVYSANPRDRKLLRKSAFKPLSKELVFDIDLTDYDEVRTCCQKTDICHKCWNFISVAIKVLDTCLRDDFGFKHILWVYSGRRGAHAWVCDKRARDLDDHKRRAIAAYLEIIRGGNQAGKRVNLPRPLHPMVSRALDTLKQDFVSNVLNDQDPWRMNAQAEKLLTRLPDHTLNDALRKKWLDDSRSSTEKWSDIDQVARTGVSKKLQTKALLEAKQDVILEYMYPRLDAEVSKHLNHLLKSPFCVHPGTGRICVPIDATNPESFDPMAVPRLKDIMVELGKINSQQGGDGNTNEIGKKSSDYENTSLKPYISLFSKFVSNLNKDEIKAKRQREEDSSSIDF